MAGGDYSEVDHVTGAAYRNSELECGRARIISGASVVVQPAEDDQISAGAAFGMLFAAAALLAIAFLAAKNWKRRPAAEVKDDISLISNSLQGDTFDDQEDPFANTIDVHKCSSIYCNLCNGGEGDTTFVPAPKKANMAETMMANGISPTVVDHANEDGFFNQKEKADEDDYELPQQAPNTERQPSNQSQGSIMRVPILSQYEVNEGRPLTPVNEIAHDSEIDTELESVADHDCDETTGDETTAIPPPPPLAFHPAYRQDSDGIHMNESSDEISI